MKIAILLAHESNLFEGVVRPFINWAHELKRKNYDIEFLLVNVGREIAEYLLESGFQFYNFDDPKALSDFCRKKGYELIFTDDYIERLKIVDKIKGDFRKAIYCQVLYGIHAIFAIPKSPSVKERLMFLIVKLVPFSILRERYTKFLRKADKVIANSQITANLLHVLYGIEPDGVVYPPIDTDIFKPQKIQKTNKVLLYLGSHAGDTDENFIRNIYRILKNKNFEVLVMGNKILQEKLKLEFNIRQISNISDKELARIYSECKLTICPQKWEQFGYVPVESMACGTPVLGFDYMGPRESIINGKTGWLAKNEQELLELLDSVLENKEIELNRDFIRRHAEENFSINASVKRLEEVLRK
jgi:glycosyltransferase involved in cell wall biosynthesis